MHSPLIIVASLLCSLALPSSIIAQQVFTNAQQLTAEQKLIVRMESQIKELSSSYGNVPQVQTALRQAEQHLLHYKNRGAQGQRKAAERSLSSARAAIVWASRVAGLFASRRVYAVANSRLQEAKQKASAGKQALEHALRQRAKVTKELDSASDDYDPEPPPES